MIVNIVLCVSLTKSLSYPSPSQPSQSPVSTSQCALSNCCCRPLKYRFMMWEVLCKQGIAERTLNRTSFLPYCPTEAHPHIYEHGRNSSNMRRTINKDLGCGDLYEMWNQEWKHPETSIGNQAMIFQLFLRDSFWRNSRIKSGTLDDNCHQPLFCKWELTSNWRSPVLT